MIKVCLADNYPVVHFGIKSYFNNHPEISLVSNVCSFYNLTDALKNKDIDVLVIDLELDDLKSVNELKTLIKSFPKTKVLVFSSLNEQIYAPNAIKAGAIGYIHKKSKLETLVASIIDVHQGVVTLSDTIKENLELIDKQNKNDRLYRKLSTRETEVLRYLSSGKKNKEISKILGLNEKTISTYKLRLLKKFNVTNLVDLVNKAIDLSI